MSPKKKRNGYDIFIVASKPTDKEVSEVRLQLDYDA